MLFICNDCICATSRILSLCLTAGCARAPSLCLFFFLTTHLQQILGADVLQTKDPYKTFELLKQHVQAVRSGDENFTCSNVCIIIERNLGFEAEHLFRECRDSIPNSSFLCEPGVERIGVLTTHSRKVAYVSVMNNLLRETRIFIERTHWIDCGQNKTITMLLEQLSFFGFAFTRPENAFQKEKVAISGKSSGGKDDLCMALLIGLFFVVENRFVTR